MTDTEYEQAWDEGEDSKAEAAPATEAVKAAKKATDESESGEFLRAYRDLDKDDKKAEEPVEERKPAIMADEEDDK